MTNQLERKKLQYVVELISFEISVIGIYTSECNSRAFRKICLSDPNILKKNFHQLYYTVNQI